ncbi:LexA repressor [compost metagenome]
MARLLEEKLGIPFYSLDSPQQALMRIKEETGIYVPDAQIYAFPKQQIPVVGTTSAGHALEIIDLYQPGVAEEWVEAYGNPGPSTFALRLDGFSMEKEFNSNDIVQIEPDLEWKVGDYVFAKRLSDHHGTFKQLKKEDDDYYLFALNEAFSPRYIKMDEDWQVVGKATWKLVKL